MRPAFDITLVTYEGAPSGARDDQVLAAAVEELGGSVRFCVWDAHNVDWSASRLTAIRSTWDYFRKIEAWRAWLSSVSVATDLVNPAALVRWNMTKSYLLDLQHSGISIVPTVIVRRGEQGDLAGISLREEWSDVVVKPAIAGSAYGARRFTNEEIDTGGNGHLRELASHGDVLVQPYQSAVEQERERSLVFVNGQFGHAFSKGAFDPGAAAGKSDERDHEPTAEELRFATRAIEAVGTPVAYARVDILPTSGGSMLMELELIEPNLAFRRSPATARTFAEGLLNDAR